MSFGMKKGLLVAIVLVISLSTSSLSALSADPGQIISNSQDWRDVYSVMLYGSFAQTATGFLVSDRHSSIFLSGVNKGTHIWVFSSRTVPYAAGFSELIESKGYTVEEFTYDNINLELARLSSARSFVVVDDSYGYNAISVAPYAAASKSFVLFADKNNIAAVTAFLDSVPVDGVIIYGSVDREVQNSLRKFNPETINKDGDRFANNVEIVKKFQKLKGSKQATFTNGEFIERSFFSGSEPVMFIGRNNIPDVVANYMKDSGITIGVLVGNDLVSTATTIRRGLGISVFVKFAQSARSSSSTISQVEGLDIFYLPVYSIDISLISVKYNSATNQLEVTIKNNVEQASYFKGTYTLNSLGVTRTVGDTDPIFLDGNAVKTMVYDVGTLSVDDITAVVFIIYGESKNSLEKTIQERFCLSCEKKIQLVNVVDECEVQIDTVSYDKGRKTFTLELSNPTDNDCFASVELVDVMVAGDRRDYGTDTITHLGPQGKKSVRISADLDEIDLADNHIVRGRALFGQRENSLIKIFEGEFELKVTSFADAFVNNLTYALLPLILIILALIIWATVKKRKSKI